LCQTGLRLYKNNEDQEEEKKENEEKPVGVKVTDDDCDNTDYDIKKKNRGNKKFVLS
jgi:hypothetical protein